VTDLIRHMSPAEVEASKVLDGSGKLVIDPENNKKTPQQGEPPASGARQVHNSTQRATDRHIYRLKG
jgi:hypothetical protein